MIGPAWTDRGRPADGYHRKRTAEDWLCETLDRARAGMLPGMVRTGATFRDAGLVASNASSPASATVSRFSPSLSRRVGWSRLAPYEEYEAKAEEILDLGNRVGLRILTMKGRPVGTRGEVELRYAAVGVWEDGKIVRMTLYTDIEEARAAAERSPGSGGRGMPSLRLHATLQC